MQLGLEDAHDRFGHGVIERIAGGADRRGHAELVNAVGVAHARVLALRPCDK